MGTLKGGYALELRFHEARSTRDLDFSIRSSVQLGQGDRVAALRDHLQSAALVRLPDYFAFIVGEAMLTLDQAPDGGARFPVDARLDGRTFGSFHVDLGVVRSTRTRILLAVAAVTVIALVLVFGWLTYHPSSPMPRAGTEGRPIQPTASTPGSRLPAVAVFLRGLSDGDFQVRVAVGGLATIADQNGRTIGLRATAAPDGRATLAVLDLPKGPSGAADGRELSNASLERYRPLHLTVLDRDIAITLMDLPEPALLSAASPNRDARCCLSCGTAVICALGVSGPCGHCVAEVAGPPARKPSH